MLFNPAVRAIVFSRAPALPPTDSPRPNFFARAFQRMVWEGLELAIILEDDAELVPGFAANLHAALKVRLRGKDLSWPYTCSVSFLNLGAAERPQELPADWEVFYLNTCDYRSGGTYHAWGQRVGPRARHLRLAVCTVGYVARYTHALRTLQREMFRVRWQIDWIFMAALKDGQLRAFVADPPLVTWTERSHQSTVNSLESLSIGALHGAYPTPGPVPSAPGGPAPGRVAAAPAAAAAVAA